MDGGCGAKGGMKKDDEIDFPPTQTFKKRHKHPLPSSVFPKCVDALFPFVILKKLVYNMYSYYGK